MTDEKKSRTRKTDADTLAALREQIAKAEAWTEELRTRERTLLAEIKAKRDALTALVLDAKDQ